MASKGLGPPRERGAGQSQGVEKEQEPQGSNEPQHFWVMYDISHDNPDGIWTIRLLTEGSFGS